jgi:hypothetical protein
MPAWRSNVKISMKAAKMKSENGVMAEMKWQCCQRNGEKPA